MQTSRVSRMGAKTRPSMYLANLPLLQAGAVIVVAIVSQAGLTWLLLLATALAAVSAAYALAIGDHHRLESFGHTVLPAPEWALLAPLAYLVLRARRTRNDSWDALKPMWIHVANLFAIPVVFFLISLFGTAVIAVGGG